MRTQLPLVGVGLAFMAPTAYAYVGPGVGLGVLGTLVGAVAVVFLALAGIVWYPLKRLLWRSKEPESTEATEPLTDEGPEEADNAASSRSSA